MKKRIADQWIAALRSGEYKQTTRFLRKGDRFCCLGVLCNLHAQAHPEIAKRELDKNVYLYNSVLLPVEVQKWAGLKSRQGYLGLTDKSLAKRNDTGFSFLCISLVISERWKEL